LRHGLPNNPSFGYEWPQQFKKIIVEVVMDSGETSRDTALAGAAAAACPAASPLSARIPGLLSIAAVPAAIAVNPFFFGLAGGLLAGISLLLAPPRCHGLGVVGLIGAVVGGSVGVVVLR
jgi:hypothetical protein